jgi:hypothetical protein
MRFATAVLLTVLLAAPALAADDASVKGGTEEVGRAIKNDVKEGYDKTKDATVDGYEKAKNATEHGVGTALDKTGAGIGKAGDAVQGAGEKVDGTLK